MLIIESTIPIPPADNRTLLATPDNTAPTTAYITEYISRENPPNILGTNISVNIIIVAPARTSRKPLLINSLIIFPFAMFFNHPLEISAPEAEIPTFMLLYDIAIRPTALIIR
jgi:hypothetical protein